MKYKISDKVRIKATNEEGEVYNVCQFLPHKRGGYGYDVTIEETTRFFREAELCDPAPVKVGDRLVLKSGRELSVVDVFENSFLLSDGNIYSFSEMEKYTIKTPDTCPHCGQVKEK